jgi:hypothetical protein
LLQENFEASQMTRCQRLGASPSGKDTGEQQAASQPRKPYFIGQTVGGVFGLIPAKELGEGEAQDFQAELAHMLPIQDPQDILIVQIVCDRRLPLVNQHMLGSVKPPMARHVTVQKTQVRASSMPFSGQGIP